MNHLPHRDLSHPLMSASARQLRRTQGAQPPDVGTALAGEVGERRQRIFLRYSTSYAYTLEHHQRLVIPGQ
jgi:hypothetical protein